MSARVRVMQGQEWEWTHLEFNFWSLFKSSRRL